MKTSELRQKTRQELVEELEGLKEEMFNLRFRSVGHQTLENPLAIRETRRTIARIKTLLSEDERGARALPKSES